MRFVKNYVALSVFARPFSGDVLELVELIFVSNLTSSHTNMHSENENHFCAKPFPVLANLLFENFWNTVRLQTFTYHFGDAPSV